MAGFLIISADAVSLDEANRLQAPWANGLSDGLAIKDIDTARRVVAELRKKLELELDG